MLDERGDHDDGDDDDDHYIFFTMSYGYEFHSMTIKVTLNEDSEKCNFPEILRFVQCVSIYMGRYRYTKRKNK